jgi:hypothetical protein
MKSRIPRIIAGSRRRNVQARHGGNRRWLQGGRKSMSRRPILEKIGAGQDGACNGKLKKIAD